MGPTLNFYQSHSTDLFCVISWLHSRVVHRPERITISFFFFLLISLRQTQDIVSEEVDKPKKGSHLLQHILVLICIDSKILEKEKKEQRAFCQLLLSLLARLYVLLLPEVMFPHHILSDDNVVGVTKPQIMMQSGGERTS